MSSLTIDQLFTPAASGVGVNPNVTPASGTWLSVNLTNLATLGLPTTAWQAGGPERTITAAMSVEFAQQDTLISLMAQGGFLPFAASGTATFVGIDGTPVVAYVTPDPSIPSQNNTGALGWLDALLQSYYNVSRNLATYATGPLAIANTGVSVLNYVAGNYHAANTTTGFTYNNQDAISIPSSAIAGTGGVITGVTTGASVTVITTQTAHGVAASDVVYVLGTVGVTGLNGVFASVVSVTSTTLTIALTTSGTWTSAGTLYLCTTVTMLADIVGIDSNASIGDVTTTVTTNTGVFISNLTSWSAANYESNADYMARGLLSLAVRSPNGASDAYEYYALTAYTLLAAQTPAVTLTNGPIAIATAFSNPQTGIETLYVSSETANSVTLGQPVTPGCVQLAIVDATNATPIVVTTGAAHGLQDGDAATISGVLGNLGTNGQWTILELSSTTFSLNDSVGTGTYTGGGTVDGGDLGQIDALIQANVVPDGIAGALVESALAFPVAVVATVVVPQAYVATYRAAAPVALAALFATYPIGGNIPTGESTGTVPISAVEGALSNAGVFTAGSVSIVRSIPSLTINGSTDDIDYPAPNYVAQLGTPTINIVGV